MLYSNQIIQEQIITIALCKVSDGGFIGWLVNTFSGKAGYCHAELIIPGGLSFSSRWDKGGVGFSRIQYNRLNWKFYSIKLSSDKVNKLMRFCMYQKGKKYDWGGVLGFILPTHEQKSRWFCSEIVVAALQQTGLFRNIPPWKVSPNTLYFMLETAAYDDFKLI